MAKRKSKLTDDFTITHGVAIHDSFVLFALSDQKLDEQKQPNCAFVALKDGKLLEAGIHDWRSAGISFLNEKLEKLIAVGEWGEVYIRGAGGVEAEERVASKKSIAARGPLRSVRFIDGKIFAAGMGRRLYMRTGAKKWSSSDTGARPPKTGKKVVGFEAIDGFSLEEMYAVGWEGEIWKWDGKKWKSQKSPTKNILTGVHCSSDGKVYICGQSGTVIVGRDDTWKSLSTSSMKEDLWSIESFKGNIYASSLNALYVYTKGTWKVCPTGTTNPKSFHRLFTSDSFLWSVGETDAIRFDGKKWSRVL